MKLDFTPVSPVKKHMRDPFPCYIDNDFYHLALPTFGFGI